MNKPCCPVCEQPLEDPTHGCEGYRHALFQWAKYYVQTEMYDRGVCEARAKVTGDAIPITSEERRLCSKYARKKQHELGLTPGTPAHADTMHLTYIGAAELLEELSDGTY
jgi:hypothetical protein